MKKILTLLSVLLSGALLVSCGNNATTKQPAEKPATTQPSPTKDSQDSQNQTEQDTTEFDSAKDSFLDALDSQLKPDDQPLVIKTSVQLSNLYQDKYTISYDIQQDAEYLKVNKNGDFEILYINTSLLTSEEKSINIVAKFTSKDNPSLSVTETYPVKAVNNTTSATIDSIISNTEPNKEQLISLSDVKVVAIMGRTVILQSQDGNIINVYDRTSEFGTHVTLNNVYTFIGFNISQYNNNNQLVPKSPAIIETGKSEDVVAQPASIKYLSTVTNANFLGNSLINNKLLLVNAKVVSDKKSKVISLQDPTDSKASITVSKYISKDIMTALTALDGQTANLYVTKYAFDGGKFQAAVLATDAPALTEDQNKVVALYNEAAKLNLDVNSNKEDNSDVFAASKDGIALSYAFPEGEEHQYLTLSGTYPVSGLEPNQIVNLIVSVTLSKDGASVTLPINSKLGHSDVVTELSAFYGETKPSGEVNVQGVVTAKIKYGFVISSTDSKYNILLADKNLKVEYGKQYKFSGMVDFSHDSPQLNNVTVIGDAQEPTQVPGVITVTVQEGVDPKYDFALLTINNVKYLKTDKYGALFEGSNGLNYQIYIKGTSLENTELVANAFYNLVNVRQSGIDKKHNKVNLSVNNGISTQTTSVEKVQTESTPSSDQPAENNSNEGTNTNNQ